MRRLAVALFVSFQVASCGQPAALEVRDAWTRDTLGRTANAALFMTIKSPVQDRLVSASAPVANKTDLMTMKGGSGAMAMDYLQAIDIPAGTPLSLDPNGLHVWLADLKQPLRAGETFSLTLNFEKAGERKVLVSVIKPSDAPPSLGT